MEALFHELEHHFTILVEYLVLLVEFIGVIVLMGAVIKGVIDILRKNEHARLNLVEGIALSVGFKIGGELLRTVIVRDWDEIILLGAVILLRAAMTFLIQWEIRLEKKNKEEKRLSEMSSDDEASA
jgi:uncharacterized membrane protein